MRLHVPYRSGGGENATDRPAYHDQRVGLLASLGPVGGVPDVDVPPTREGRPG